MESLNEFVESYSMWNAGQPEVQGASILRDESVEGDVGDFCRGSGLTMGSGSQSMHCDAGSISRCMAATSSTVGSEQELPYPRVHVQGQTRRHSGTSQNEAEHPSRPQ